jgi:GNAT superfamily N-acetyltransferase
VIAYRCFRNEDPVRLADVWRSAALGPGAMQPMTASLLEEAVFSKPYFDREGLVVACDDGRPVGFAHAGFGSNGPGTAIDTSTGATLLVVVAAHAAVDEIAAGLLARCEEYLRRRGATTLLGGGSSSMRSFYLGLYGGADLPGILDSSLAMRRAFEQAGYVAAERIAVLRRPLSGFRPPVNRVQLALRRETTLRAIDEPPRRSWWEAATLSAIAVRRYELVGQGDEPLGAATYWSMQPFAGTLGVTAAGLLHVGIEAGRRRQGLGHYLVAESLHHLAQEGVTMAEMQVPAANTAALGLCAKLGFETVEQGTVFGRP